MNIFFLECSTDGEPNIFEARSEGPKIQEVSHFCLIEIYQIKSKKFRSVDIKIKDRHLVYEFFDTSQG